MAEENMRQAVYIVKSEGGMVKIGISRDPDGRMKTLSTASPYKLTLEHIEWFDDDVALLVEQAAHLILVAHRQNGEWFSVEVPVALDAVKAAVRIVRLCCMSNTSTSITERIIDRRWMYPVYQKPLHSVQGFLKMMYAWVMTAVGSFTLGGMTVFCALYGVDRISLIMLCSSGVAMAAGLVTVIVDENKSAADANSGIMQTQMPVATGES